MKELELDIKAPHSEISVTENAEGETTAVAAAEKEEGAIPPPPRRAMGGGDTSAADVQATQSQERVPSFFRDLLADEDIPLTGKAFKELLGGAGLVSVIRHNWLFLFVLISLVITYVALGYEIRNERLENDRLTQELNDRRYKSLIRSSELCERTLRSKVENLLPDSSLHTSTVRSFSLPVNRGQMPDD